MTGTVEIVAVDADDPVLELRPTSVTVRSVSYTLGAVYVWAPLTTYGVPDPSGWVTVTESEFPSPQFMVALKSLAGEVL